ncbi:MAG: dihydrolipoamide acetyltransferase family protein [Flavobacteriaceae bacterium]|tara:strand:- start:1253 stop:2620 length:1368 start_codon:yes stop_codon:yes gene_type:complete
MGKLFVKLPSMGESINEATLTSWLKNVGDKIEIDESIVEVSTDKVDSDVPSEVSGILVEKKFKVNDVIKIGEVIAVIDSKDEGLSVNEDSEVKKSETIDEIIVENKTESVESLDPQEIIVPKEILDVVEEPVFKEKIETDENQIDGIVSSKYLSPLVKSIVKKEGVSADEMLLIDGTGEKGRITKNDILSYISSREENKQNINEKEVNEIEIINKSIVDNEVISEMTRIQKITSDHMIDSYKKSVHVQSFVEADVSELWNWYSKNKNEFLNTYNTKLTLTPIFISAVIRALSEFPILNSSVENDKIITKKRINIGMATALEGGNLIVPVIKDANHLNLAGLAKSVNDLSTKARQNQLQPDDTKDGTYTVTNIGNFGSIMGTPIINQPQVGIIAFGVIRKMPSVIETSDGDFLGIRKKIIMTHSYDHRIINGAVGGNFVKNVAEYLENWKADAKLS